MVKNDQSKNIDTRDVKKKKGQDRNDGVTAV